MNIIPWNDSFLVKIDEIDRQHEKLVGLVNKLAAAMSEGKGKEVLGNIIKELVAYTLVHFNAEERILKLVNYPESEQHKKEHADFVQKIKEFKDGFERGQLGLTVGVMNFLCDWVRSHIKQSDKKYARFIDEQRVSN